MTKARPAAGAPAGVGRDVFVLDYVRTPRGRAAASGGLHHRTPLDLVGSLLGALAERNRLADDDIDDLILGVASQTGEQGADLARTAAVLAGLPGVPGVTVNRFCASGIDAVSFGAAKIAAGQAQLIIAGGVESVSRVPIFSDGGALWADPDVRAAVGSIHMGVAADINATIDGWTRDELDDFALRTHAKAAAARAAGAFDRALIPQPGADGGPGLDHDELVRPGLTAEALAGLRPAFAEFEAQDALVAQKRPDLDPIDHVHTVGTSPAMADAAALLLLGDEATANRLGVEPRARIVAAAATADDPVIMLTAGQRAAEAVIDTAGLSPHDVDVFEFAEAFAALCLRFSRDLSVGDDRLNPNGGTMAAGHAFGATGAIMVGGCVDELHRRGGRYGVAAVSGAAGVGSAVLVERL